MFQTFKSFNTFKLFNEPIRSDGLNYLNGLRFVLLNFKIFVARANFPVIWNSRTRGFDSRQGVVR